MKLAFAIVLLCSTPLFAAVRGGGYQLKYKPIPPKPKVEEKVKWPAPVDEDAAIVRRIQSQPKAGNVPTEDAVAKQQRIDRNAADYDARLQERFRIANEQEAKRQAYNQRVAEERRQNYNRWVGFYNAELFRQRQLESDAYDAGRAAEQGAMDAQWEYQRWNGMIYSPIIATPYGGMYGW